MKILTWETCDRKFRTFLVKKFGGERCLKCRRREWTDLAHYIDRDVYATRWQFANILMVCRPCHRYFDLGSPLAPGHKNHRMRPYMVKTFGEELVGGMEELSMRFTKRRDAILAFMEAAKRWV